MKKFWQKYRNTLLLYLSGLLIGFGYGVIMEKKLPDLGVFAFIVRYLEGIVFFAVAIVLQIALHEIGHMLAGLLRGWKFISFMLFGVLLSRKDGRFHLSRFNIAGAGGQCLMLPPEDGDTRNGILFYNAGGYLMNLLVALVSLGLIAAYWNGLNYEATSFLFGLTLSGLLFAAMNGIPSIAGGIPNDGSNIRSLKNDAYSREIFIISLRTIGLMQLGQGLLDIQPGYFTDHREVDYSNPIHGMALSYDLSLAVASHDFEKAHQIVNRIFQHETEIIPFYVNEIRMETIYLYLVDPQPDISPFNLLDSALKRHIDMQESFRPTAIRVKYAWYKLFRHDEEEAGRLYSLFEKVARGYHIPGELDTERELLDYARHLPTMKYADQDL